MNPSVKELLIELTSVGKRKTNYKILETAKHNMDVKDFIICVDNLLHWQKHIHLRHLPVGDFQKDRLILEGHPKRRIRELFKDNDVLNQVYTLEEDHLKFNPSLTQEEIDEILEFIHENHKILVRKRRSTGNVKCYI